MTENTEKCKNCKHANYYPVYWWYPYLDPKCSISKQTITPENTCKHFTLIGRLSR